MVNYCRIPIQWQKTYGNRKNTIWVKLWKASMERWSCGTIRDFKSGRVSYRTTKELGTGYKGNGRSTEEHEKTIWQEKAKSSRTEGWRQHMAIKQKYSIKLILKEVR